MTVEDHRIFHIRGTAASLKNMQIGLESSINPDLGFPLWMGKANDGTIQRFLAKDRPASVEKLYLPLSSSTGRKLEISTDADDAVFHANDGALRIRDAFTDASDNYDDDGIKVFASVDEVNAIDALTETGSIAAGILASVASLPEGAVGYGSSAGNLIGDASKLAFDDRRYNLKCGQNIAVDASASGILALSGGSSILSIGASAFDTLAIGSGTIGDVSGLVCVSIGDIGNNSNSHTSDGMNQALIVGTAIVADGDYSYAHGSTIDMDASFASAHGISLSVAHNYAEVRGQYGVSMWPGARFTSPDRHNSISGNCQAFDGWVLVGETDGDETITLLPGFGSSDTYSFKVPDGMAVVMTIDLYCADTGADSASKGFRHYRADKYAWFNSGYGNFKGENGTLINSHIVSGTYTWSVSMSSYDESSTGEFGLKVTTSGAIGTVVHIARIRGIIGPCTWISNS